MAIFPITLEGDNLGKRHQYLNALVNDTYNKNVPFESIQNLPEYSAIDRLFKIDLANKYRHLDYILKTLKDEDMLFVSRALNCTWLLQNHQVMNPTYLENELYPHMLTTASNKMKHWIHLHLKNETQCHLFYLYYKNRNIDFALKFLPKCPANFFLQEMKLIPLDKITPHLLKLLCEKSARAAKIYFQDLKTGGRIDEKFIHNIQFLLKTHPRIYFDIIDRFFLMGFRRLNKETTRYIMENHRRRFFAKQELYTQRLLDLPTLAKYLSSEQTKKLITSLARAKYFEDKYWFSYKVYEPLIKKINIIEKNQFCNKIFKEKQVGELCSTAPYPIPPLAEKRKLANTANQDLIDWKDYDSLLNGPLKYPKLRGGGGGGFDMRFILQQLFDQYRFWTFEKTFTDIQKKIKKESHYIHREAMLLVLVSKTGGRVESLETLLHWLVERFSNEPIMVRAAIVRSLVKRAAVWRVPNSTWSLLLRFGHDLGLNGGSSDLLCHEGLHCVVLRHLLFQSACASSVWTTFLRNFSPLTEYSLTAEERRVVHATLPELLLKSISAKPTETNTYLELLCDALDAYGLRVDSYPGALTAITNFVSTNPAAARPLLRRLFESRVACKRFFAYYFTVIQTDASYLNALRHNAKILESKTEFEKLLTNNIEDFKHEMFFRKLIVYFGEDGGLAEQYMTLLRQRAAEEPHPQLARPIARLSKVDIYPLLPPPADAADDCLKRSYKQMIVALQQNTHLTRPVNCPLKTHDKPTNPHELAVWVHTCSPVILQHALPALLSHGHSARLVLALRAPAERRLVAAALPHAARSRTLRALRIALRLIRYHPFEQTLQQDWAILKSILLNVALKGKKMEVYCDLAKLNAIPKEIRLEYSIALYEALSKVGYEPAPGLSHRIALPLLECILDHWDSVDELLIQKILNDFTNYNLTQKMYYTMRVFYWDWSKPEYVICFPGMTQKALDGDYYNFIKINLRILVRFLLSSDSDWVESVRIRLYLKPFLKQVKNVINEEGGPNIFKEFLGYLECIEALMKNLDCSKTLAAVKSFTDNIAPINENCQLNLRVRFTILNQKAFKKYFETRPDSVNEGKIIKSQEFQDNFMFTFGQLAAEDLEKMVAENFQSIRELYYDTLANFIDFKIKSLRMSIIFILGLIHKSSQVNAMVVGAMLYNKCVLKAKTEEVSPLLHELYNSLKTTKSLEVQMFLNHNICNKCMSLNRYW